MNPFDFKHHQIRRIRKTEGRRAYRGWQAVCWARPAADTDPPFAQAWSMLSLASTRWKKSGVISHTLNRGRGGTPRARHWMRDSAGRAVGQAATGVMALAADHRKGTWPKLVALLLASDEDRCRLKGVRAGQGRACHWLLIPNDRWYRSEVTAGRFITVGAEEKRGVSSPCDLPDMPFWTRFPDGWTACAITGATGPLCDGPPRIESYASVNANNNPRVQAARREALRLLGAISEAVVATAAMSTPAVANVDWGPLLAGQAFANSPIAADALRCLSHAAAPSHPARLSNALVLPHVLRFKRAHTPAVVYARSQQMLSPALAEVEVVRPATEALYQCALRAFRPKARASQRLRDVDIPQSAIPKDGRKIMVQARLLVNNPRDVTQGRRSSIYEAGLVKGHLAQLPQPGADLC